MENGNNGNDLELHNGERRRFARIVEWIVIALAVVLAVLVVFFVLGYVQIREERILNARQAFESLLTRHGPLAAADVGAIRGWMTFDYVNRAFKLPAPYLQSALPVSDQNYPQLSIASYAHDENESEVAALAAVERAITNYFANASSSSVTAKGASSGASARTGAGGSTATATTTP